MVHALWIINQNVSDEKKKKKTLSWIFTVSQSFFLCVCVCVSHETVWIRHAKRKYTRAFCGVSWPTTFVSSPIGRDILRKLQKNPRNEQKLQSCTKNWFFHYWPIITCQLFEKRWSCWISVFSDFLIYFILLYVHFVLIWFDRNDYDFRNFF